MARIRPSTAPEENPQPPPQSPARDRSIQQRPGPQHSHADIQTAEQVQTRDQGGEEGAIAERSDGCQRGEEEGGREQEAVYGMH